jgi:pimeloyl-ACP methyl ester carboxylesterase
MFEIPSFPPPGKLVDIGTHKLHMHSQGEGTPVVILDAGGWDNVLAWREIQPEFAKFTQVIAYDRSGLGWSERGPNLISRDDAVAELHAFLTSAQVSGPYVLVGHSLGGVHVLMFAQAYPELTAGLVLVDGAHENIYSEWCLSVPGYLDWFAGQIQMFEELSQKPHHEIVAHFLGKSVSGVGELSEVQQIAFDRLRPTHMATIAEMAKSFTSPPTPLEHVFRSLGDLPLIVLTASKSIEWGLGEEDNLKMSEVYRDVQVKIAGLSSRSKQIFVQDAGHYIQNDQPQVVIDAIREMVETVRSK